ncbi:alanine racemase [Paracrocinitomix mangrovi]|uniref:alanine racemase n=1 Tax=Paracrocinitomix mangrovi TaxID=2862509 RepID=UPI001C8D10CB|nr:alanine racemase [Paracrocinitomix mangrovi]UKN00740.1 alanine racemase [Paracrocinitomix mangrovi]
MNLNLPISELLSLLEVDLTIERVSDNLLLQHVIIDSRSPRINSSSLFFALKGLKDDGHNYLSEFAKKGGEVAIVNEVDTSVDIFQIPVKDSLEALQKLAIHHRSKFDYPVIGITGSNGKTIVKEWLYHVLKDDFNVVRSPKSYNSQIGVALSVLGMTMHHNLAIIEAGISKPGEMAKLWEMIKPTHGIFTGLGDAHDINFESNDQKRKEKFLLFKNVRQIINAEELKPLVRKLPFHDKASISNATTVYYVAQTFGLSEERVLEKLTSLPVVSMRLEQIQGQQECLLINDAYSADFASLEIALSHLSQVARDRKKVLILSFAKNIMQLTEDDILRDMLSTADLSEVVFIGEENILQKAGVDGHYYKSIDDYLNNPIEFKNAAILFKGSRKNNLERLVHHYADKKHITQLEVNLSAIRHNLNYFRSRLEPEVKTLAMVKAQSYGTGLVEIAEFLQNEGVDYLGVAYTDEGVTLRKAGITLPILVMNPEKNAFDDIVEYELEPSIYSLNSLQSFLHHLILKNILGFPIHIKLDTGMNRLGFVDDDLDELIETLETQPEVYVKSVFSHLAVADDAGEKNFTFKQIRQFEIMTGQLMQNLTYSFDRHLANSSGCINFNSAHYNMVRIGIGMYGLLSGERQHLENVLTLTSEISQIKLLKEGDSLGYGRTFIAQEATAVAIVPVGYADGLRRGLSNGNWQVIINGKKARIIGTICMDMCMVNVTDIEASVGDRVQIFGDENSIFEMAKNLYTIPYEIISAISSRVHRVYLD